jgi:ubiquinone/menaquinone biosynthesis C-methylase UbiE
MRRQFDRLAPVWDEMLSPEGTASFEAALAALPASPERVLDVGTGTGRGALAVARQFGGADVVGVDMAEEMLSRAREKTPPELTERVRFEVGDAARLPFEDRSFDLVTHANMIPFFDEVARVLRPGGHAIFAFSSGPETPIYVATERLRRELEKRGFEDVHELAAGPGTAVLARRKSGA